MIGKEKRKGIAEKGKPRSRERKKKGQNMEDEIKQHSGRMEGEEWTKEKNRKK